MAADALEAKQHAHQLLDELGPDQMAAVLQLLEVMVEPEGEPLTEEDRRAVAASREYIRQNPQGGVPLEEVAAECGFTTDQIRDQEDWRGGEQICFQPDAPAWVRAIAQPIALGILKAHHLKALHRYAETGHGRVKSTASAAAATPTSEDTTKVGTDACFPGASLLI